MQNEQNNRTPAPAPVGGDVVKALRLARRVLACQPHPLTSSAADDKRHALAQIDAALQSPPAPAWQQWDIAQPEPGTKVAIACDDGCSIAAAFMSEGGPLHAEDGEPIGSEFTKGSIWTALPDDHLILFMEVTPDDWK